MAYCTQADLLKQIGEPILRQLTDDNNVGIVAADIVSNAIQAAEAEVDSYCGARYDVPFTTVPTMVNKVAVDIAIYNLYARRRGAPDDIKKRYDDAISFLKDISKGLATLGSIQPSADDDTGPEATSSKTDRIFTLGKISDGTSGSLDNY